MSTETFPKSCDECGRMDCALSFARKGRGPVSERVAWVLDDAWPEYRAYLKSTACPDDQVLAPGGRFGLTWPRYAWPGAVKRMAPWATLRRHWAMARVREKTGAVRQATYLRHDEHLAGILGRAIDFRVTHLVLSQVYLPWFHRMGFLGGRTWDILMTRYPMAVLHGRLDQANRGSAGSPTLADFRADAAVVADETEALAGARHLITPHHGIAALFPNRAKVLDWNLPPVPTVSRGHRVAFLGPTIERQGAGIVRDLARRLKAPLVLFGPDLEGKDYWNGVGVERRSFGPLWLSGIGAILHPALATHQPRRLLEAWRAGVTLYADAGCGLPAPLYQPLSAFHEPDQRGESANEAP